MPNVVVSVKEAMPHIWRLNSCVLGWVLLCVCPTLAVAQATPQEGVAVTQRVNLNPTFTLERGSEAGEARQ
jgi:hypothetical protein